MLKKLLKVTGMAVFMANGLAAPLWYLQGITWYRQLMHIIAQ